MIQRHWYRKRRLLTEAAFFCVKTSPKVLDPSQITLFSNKTMTNETFEKILDPCKITLLSNNTIHDVIYQKNFRPLTNYTTLKPQMKAESVIEGYSSNKNCARFVFELCFLIKGYSSKRIALCLRYIFRGIVRFSLHTERILFCRERS